MMLFLAAALAILHPAPQLARELHGVRIPVLAPTHIDASYGGGYLHGETFAPYDGYTIIIGAVPDCDGTACTFAEVDGGSTVEPLPAHGTHVRLADGTSALFATHPCGANCMGSHALFFTRRGVRYEISDKGGTAADLASIANGLRPL
jgi:hypothetical protein